MAALTSPPEDLTVLDRLRRGLHRLGCSGVEVAALALLLAGGGAALGLLWVLARPGAGPAADLPEPAGEAGSPGDLASGGEELVVHVAGEVAAPGLHHLPAGTRVADALEAAGGPLPDAELDALNLARPLTDGEQLFVPGPAPPPGQAAAGHTEQGGAAPPSALRPDGLLDLNRATPADLEELPGLGPVLAERIVQHRDSVGGFGAVGDLREVPGIGEKKFQSIAELVAV